MSQDSLSLEQPTVTNKKKVVIAVFLTVMAILILGGSAYFIFREDGKDKKEIGQAGAGAEGSKGGMTTSDTSVDGGAVDPAIHGSTDQAQADAEEEAKDAAEDNASTQANSGDEAAVDVTSAQSQASEATASSVTSTDADAEKVETEVKASTSTSTSTTSELQPATSTVFGTLAKTVKENRNIVFAGLMGGLALAINARGQN